MTYLGLLEDERRREAEAAGQIGSIAAWAETLSETHPGARRG